MRILTLSILLLSGCTVNLPQMGGSSQSSKQDQTQRMSNTQDQTASTTADQSSSHASESKQGTNSMPIIVVCVQNNSGRSNCAVPSKSLSESVMDIKN